MPLIEHRSLHCRGPHFRVVAVKEETKSPLFACSDHMVFTYSFMISCPNGDDALDQNNFILLILLVHDQL